MGAISGLRNVVTYRRVDGRQLQTIPCSTTTNDCGAFCVYAFTSRASNDYVGAEFEIPLTIPETSIDLIKLSL